MQKTLPNSLLNAISNQYAGKRNIAFIALQMIKVLSAYHVHSKTRHPHEAF